MSALDETDVKILGILEKDGRRSFTDIAQELGLNEATVRKRVSALQKELVIKKFTVVVDHAKVGMKTVAVVGIEVDPACLLEAAQSLCEFKEIRCVATSSGDHMIMTEIWTKDGRELTRLISEKILALDGVKRVCPAILLEKLKE
jgi:Lrp/AsnC family transcriptional regulator for asnA, asnC and gidA